MREDNDSGDDSDIQEIIVIPAGTSHRSQHSNANSSTYSSSPVAKRRRSSPQMDPIPTYTPTPIHILEQRLRDAPSRADDDNYYRSSSAFDSGAYDDYDSTAAGDYVPLLEPSPHVISCSESTGYSLAQPVNRVTSNAISSRSAKALAPRLKKNSVGGPRPVSSALGMGARHRSLPARDLNDQARVLEDHVRRLTNSNEPIPQRKSAATEYDAERPHMWSPQVPQPEANQADPQGSEPISVEDYSKYQSVKPAKQRLAHKPTKVCNKNNRPRVPHGVSKKVPMACRVKGLDAIITEYLNTGHSEEESYEKGLKDESALAERALSKMTYMNNVAGLKRRLREKAGVSTLPPDEDPEFVNGNKVVSHEEILTGKVKGTFSIEKKRRISDPSELNEQELYRRLSRYIMPSEEISSYGYPCRDPDEPELRMAPLGKDGQKVTLRRELAPSYTCDRCAKVYRIDEDGMPLPTVGKCIFHPGHLWNVRISRALEKRYSCCKGDPSAGGCSSNIYHVHNGSLELENYKGYVETQPKPELDPDKHGLYALDCEMCYTTYGLELTRVTVVDHKHNVVYEKLVKPKNPILDYNTKFSGIKPGDLDDVDTSLADVQKDLLNMFSSKTILIGHSLDSDMKALKIFHKRFIDTAQLFPHKRGLPFKRALRTLMVENLQVIIQEDAGHDSKEDACAAFRLVMWKAKTDVPPKST